MVLYQGWRGPGAQPTGTGDDQPSHSDNHQTNTKVVQIVCSFARGGRAEAGTVRGGAEVGTLARDTSARRPARGVAREHDVSRCKQNKEKRWYNGNDHFLFLTLKFTRFRLIVSGLELFPAHSTIPNRSIYSTRRLCSL